jgi:hypothetical protein
MSITKSLVEHKEPPLSQREIRGYVCYPSLESAVQSYIEETGEEPHCYYKPPKKSGKTVIYLWKERENVSS